MKTYIATFFSHFGAVRFKKQCDKNNISARMMPVPRFLSSSCGTCVKFECQDYVLPEQMPEELEQIVETENEKYVVLYHVE